MAKKFLISSVLATLLMTVWGMLFWAVLYAPLGVFDDQPQGAEVSKTLQAANTPTGTYFFPWPRTDFESWTAQHKQGPFYQLHYVRSGVDPNSPLKMVLGMAHTWIAACLGLALVWVLGPQTRAKLFRTLVTAGLLGTWYIRIGEPVWFHLPWKHNLAVSIYDIGSWLILAAVLAGRHSNLEEPLAPGC